MFFLKKNDFQNKPNRNPPGSTSFSGFQESSRTSHCMWHQSMHSSTSSFCCALVIGAEKKKKKLTGSKSTACILRPLLQVAVPEESNTCRWEENSNSGFSKRKHKQTLSFYGRIWKQQFQHGSAKTQRAAYFRFTSQSKNKRSKLHLRSWKSPKLVCLKQQESEKNIKENNISSLAPFNLARNSESICRAS